MEKIFVVPLIFAHNNDQDVIKQRLNAKSSVDSSLKYCISQVMAENEVKFWLGSSRAPRQMNTWFYFPPMAIHYSLSEGIHFYIRNFLPPTPWIPQTIHFGRLFILRVIHFERDHCIGREVPTDGPASACHFSRPQRKVESAPRFCESAVFNVTNNPHSGTWQARRELYSAELGPET